MNPYEFLNARTTRLSMTDLKLSQAAAMCGAILIAKAFPPLLDISGWWFLVAMIGLYVKPLYVFYRK